MVEVYIYVLCKKFGSYFIQNICGVGYVILCEVVMLFVEFVGDDVY